MSVRGKEVGGEARRRRASCTSESPRASNVLSIACSLSSLEMSRSTDMSIGSLSVCKHHTLHSLESTRRQVRLWRSKHGGSSSVHQHNSISTVYHTPHHHAPMIPTRLHPYIHTHTLPHHTTNHRTSHHHTTPQTTTPHQTPHHTTHHTPTTHTAAYHTNTHTPHHH